MKKKEPTPIQQYIDRIVAGYLGLYPDASGEGEKRIRRLIGFDVEPLLKFNERFPTDLLSLTLALAVVDDHVWLDSKVRLPGADDIQYVLDLIPEVCSEVRVKITPGVTISGNWGKHSSVFWEVKFKDLIYPFEMTAVQYCDMDDMDNHGDECPMRYDEEDEEYSDDCNCEASIEEQETLKLAEKDDDTSDVKVREFLEKIVGY